jgi:hypothetical protein
MANLKMKKVDMPIITTTIQPPVYYQARAPTLAVPDMPDKVAPTQPYVFQDKVCGELDCNVADQTSQIDNCQAGQTNHNDNCQADQNDQNDNCQANQNDNCQADQNDQNDDCQADQNDHC